MEEHVSNAPSTKGNLLNVNRRDLIMGTVGAVSLAGLPSPAMAAHRPIRRSYGLCVHTDYRTSVYANDAAVLRVVKDSGAVRIRDRVSLAWPGQVPLFMNKYLPAGIKGHLAVGFYDRPAERAEYLRKLRAMAPFVAEVSGFNEPDRYDEPRSEWIPRVRRHQRWLYNEIKSDPRLAHIQVLPGALRDANENLRSDLAALYDAVDGMYDAANLHLYPGTDRVVADHLDDRLRMLPRGVRVVISEGGATTYKVTGREQARICRQMLNACHERDVRLYIYEALNDRGTDPQSLFGIYTADYQPRRAARVLRRLVSP